MEICENVSSVAWSRILAAGVSSRNLLWPSKYLNTKWAVKFKYQSTKLKKYDRNSRILCSVALLNFHLHFYLVSVIWLVSTYDLTYMVDEINAQRSGNFLLEVGCAFSLGATDKRQSPNLGGLLLPNHGLTGAVSCKNLHQSSPWKLRSLSPHEFTIDPFISTWYPTQLHFISLRFELPVCLASRAFLQIGRFVVSGLPAYSDNAGTAEKCHCKRASLYPTIFSIRRSFFGPKNCHCSRSVTLTGVAVSGEACITCYSDAVSKNRDK